MSTFLRPFRLLIATLVVVLAVPAAAGASSTQESIFQDDPLLVYGDETTQKRTLDRLKRLGVDRIRVSVFWRLVAPDTDVKPAGFNSADPAAYPPGAWDRYDRLLVAAKNRGIAVNLNITSPVPNWAAGRPDRADIRETYTPDAEEFGRFVIAVGTRYNGRTPGLPRISYWSIWNEPNQPGWLTPQWVADPKAPGGFAEAAPRIYRALVEAAQAGLTLSGHANDTILIGETAPKGQPRARGETRALRPRTFILRTYCLDDNGQALKGAAAVRNGCPTSNPIETFRQQHPGLFRITGWAHHPYELAQPPTARPSDRENYTTGNLRDLSSLMGRIFRRYGQRIPGGGKGGFPLYLTEYGYQTNPPDPVGVSLARQASYLNESEYMTWRMGGVKALSQFLLVDDKPVEGKTALARYGATFQSGLTTLAGKRKPGYAAYRFPIHIAKPRARRGGGRVAVWGLLRPGRPGRRESVRIEGRPSGAKKYRTLRTVRTDSRRHYLHAGVTIRRTTRVRLAWRSPAGGTIRSRSVNVTVPRR
jgi:hypothetical protein